MSPAFLPDGRRFIYLAVASRIEDRALVVGSLNSELPTPLLKTVQSAAYAAPGYLLFAQNHKLLAQRFDSENLRLTGEPAAIDELPTSPFGGWSPFSVSNTGVLVYRRQAGATEPPTRLMWFNRQGRQLDAVGPTSRDYSLALASDERHVVVARDEEGRGQPDIWVLDLARGVPSRLTADPEVDEYSVWSPDGRSVAFTSHRRSGIGDLYRTGTSGTGEEKVLLTSQVNVHPTDWSRDGRFILYIVNKPGGGGQRDLWVLDMTTNRTAAFLQAPHSERFLINVALGQRADPILEVVINWAARLNR